LNPARRGRYTSRVKYRFLPAVLLAILLIPNNAFAWGHKEHIQLTRIAVGRLLADPATPEAMKAWLRSITPNVYDMTQEEQFFLKGKIGDTKDGAGLTGIEYWAIAPDLFAKDKNTKIEPYNSPERPLHFIDLELVLPAATKKGYRHDLSGKPKIDEIPRDLKDERYVQAGYLPFRVEESYNKLVAAIKDGKLAPADPKSREWNESALRWAGYLAHYIGDNFQPHHATIDFQSKSYFANRQKAPNIHNEMEFRMNDDDKDDFADVRPVFWAAFVKELATAKDDAPIADQWKASLEVSFKAYDALPLIGLAAMKAAGQGGTPDAPKGDITGKFDSRAFFNFRGTYDGREMSVMEMKAHQQALAVVRIQKLLRQAWDEGTAK
jgi:hypothetical protein